MKFLRQSDFLGRNVGGSFPAKKQIRKKKNITNYFKNLKLLGVDWTRLKKIIYCYFRKQVCCKIQQ